MAMRKLNQEMDKCFKKVAEGSAEFESIYEKIQQSNNAAQKEKLEDQLKREIKKLQRLRDQIKSWAQSNDIKDKTPLLEHRRLIETHMEKFKAVEKAMKTKAYSKEGLQAQALLDPKDQAKMEASEFLSEQVETLEQQIEALEAEGVTIQAGAKRGKLQPAKAERMAQVEAIIERHKWHQGKLELIRRSLENGGVEPEQVKDIEESIKFYVTNGQDDDYMEDEGMYDELNLEQEEDVYGMNVDNDKGSSQENTSVQGDPMEPETKAASVSAGKQRAAAQDAAASGRRPSTQLKSPLPTLATVHSTSLSTIPGGSGANAGMKPAPAPTRPAGEGLKYASAAAAAADKSNVGIAPLPPPPSAAPAAGAPVFPPSQPRTSTTSSPSTAPIQPVAQERPPSVAPPSAVSATAAAQAAPGKAESKTAASRGKAPSQPPAGEPVVPPSKAPPNGVANGIRRIKEEEEQEEDEEEEEEEDEESIYHLPADLQDLVESYEETKKRAMPLSEAATQRLQLISETNKPEVVDAEGPRTYRPDDRYTGPPVYFPQEPLPIFDDSRLYSKIDPDTLFYVFYYKQGTYQQYLAAKALKDQSWRFHKQYQTWFQRHEEPKSITEEFEQGTYRFFDYESTWMNRRKADFKFAYKFLEDDV